MEVIAYILSTLINAIAILSIHEMDSIMALIPTLSIADQDSIMLHILQNRSPAPVKKSKKIASTSSIDGEKIKKVQTENQKVWTNFIKQVRDTIRESTWEDKFTYKNAMNIASIIKKKGSGAIDNEIILETYHTWRKENQPSPSCSYL